MRIVVRAFADGAGGTVAGVVAYPDRPQEALSVVLAHGAGSDMHSPLLVFLQERLADAGYSSTRFNFPYKEQGRRIPDRTPVLERCFRSVLAALREELGVARLVIGGTSMGGRMATHLAAAGDELDGLILLGYPLHPAGRPEKLRTAHWPHITAPMLFFAGTRDGLCTLSLLRDAMTSLNATATLHVIDDGDHSFAVRRSTGRTPRAVHEEIATVMLVWLGRLAT